MGGRVEDGEDVLTAALREAREETGRDDIRIGPAVWYGEQILAIAGQPTLFKETFVVAHAARSEVTDARWSAAERAIIREVRWWSLDEIAETADTILPSVLAELLPPILAGAYPDPPLTVEL